MSRPGGRASVGRLLAAAGLAAAVLACYGGVARNQFVRIDDQLYLTDNPRVQQGLTSATFAWAWTSREATNWHPLTWISHALDWTLYGADPRGHHQTSAVLHAVNAVLVLQIVGGLLAFWRAPPGGCPATSPRRGEAVSESPRPDSISFAVAWFAAALWALHPLRVESVAWAAERKDVLSGLFWLLATAAYLRWVGRGYHRRDYLAVIAAMAVGLLAKPMLVTLPFTLLLLDVWPLGRLRAARAQGASLAAASGRLLAEKWPLFALSLASSAVTFWAQQTGGAVVSVAALPPVTRLATVILAYGMYLWSWVWPARLAVFYPLPNGLLGGAPLAYPPVILSAAALVVTSAVVVWQRGRRPYLLIGWLWYLGTLVPVVGLVKVGDQAWADRYTYLPHLGLLVMFAPWFDSVCRAGRASRTAAAAAGAALLAASAVLTWLQVGTWRNTETLALRALAVTEGNYLAFYLRGVAAEQNAQPDAAAEFFRQALAANPRYYLAAHDLAKLDLDRGELDRAEAGFRSTVELAPNQTAGYAGLAAVEARRGRLAEARQLLLTVARLDPDDAAARINLARVTLAAGQDDEARRWFAEAARLDPALAAAEAELARALGAPSGAGAGR